LESRELLRGQEEWYWTGMAGVSLGGLEIASGRYEDARAHLLESRELADRLGYDWLSAWSRTQLATISVAAGRLDEARALLEEGLTLTLTIHNMRNLSLILVASARLAFAVGDPAGAAQLAGAAQGLRERVGLRPWPMLRRGEDELMTKLRQALGPDRFEEAFAAGTRLNQREAIAAAQDTHAAGVPTS
jgi:Tetratricopeptide repeat